MITPRHLAGAALIISWAMLISARCIAAAVYATRPSGTYQYALDHIGWLMPVAAWLALLVGLYLALTPIGGVALRSSESRPE